MFKEYLYFMWKVNYILSVYDMILWYLIYINVFMWNLCEKILIYVNVFFIRNLYEG